MPANNRCTLRYLAQQASAVFKDSRQGKQWLHNTRNVRLNYKKPIDLIRYSSLKPEYILTELYIDAAQDNSLFSRETYAERVERIKKMAGLVHNFDEVARTRWLDQPSPFDGNKNPRTLLQTARGTRLIEDALTDTHVNKIKKYSHG